MQFYALPVFQSGSKISEKWSSDLKFAHLLTTVAKPWLYIVKRHKGHICVILYTLFDAGVMLHDTFFA